MKYSINKLAKMYNEFLSQADIEVDLNISQPIDISTYNEYRYKKMMKNFDVLYNHTESIDTTEHFLKGD